MEALPGYAHKQNMEIYTGEECSYVQYMKVLMVGRKGQ